MGVPRVAEGDADNPIPTKDDTFVQNSSVIDLRYSWQELLSHATDFRYSTFLASSDIFRYKNVTVKFSFCVGCHFELVGGCSAPNLTQVF